MITIKDVKDELHSHIGKIITIKYNLGRNKFEKYDVKIKKLYDHVFTVELDNSKYKEVKSFSYSDIITKTIKIDY